MAVQLGVSQPRYSHSTLGISRRLSLQRNFSSVSMKNFSSGPLFPTLPTSFVPTLKPVVGSARAGCGVYMNMKATEFNQRVYQVVAEFNIGASSPTAPILNLSSQSSPQPTAVINIAHLVLEYLKLHDEEIMMNLKTLSNVPPRVTEYMECYALLLEKFEVLERGNKFLDSFALFVSVIMFFASLISYLVVGTFDHLYYGVKLTERMSNKSEGVAAVGCCEKDDLKPPFLFKLAEIIKILLNLGNNLIKWLYAKIRSCSFLHPLQFLKSIIKEVKRMMKAGDGDEE